MYVDNRTGGDSIRASLRLTKEDSNGNNKKVYIDVSSVLSFFALLLGIAFAVVGACAFGYGLYVAIFLNRI